VFLPLRDDNPRSRIGLQVVTITILTLSVLVFLYQITLPEAEQQAFVYGFGFVPVTLFGELSLPPELYRIPPWATLFSSMFLHGGVMHIAGNMLFLWIFADNIEDALGHIRFVVFYFLCGLAAALLHGAVDPASEVPTIGASGAISGVLGGYLMLYPRRGVWVLILFRFTTRMPAWGVLGLWAGLQVLNATLLADSTSNTAWWAHIGGFLAGALLVIPLRRRDIPLFDRNYSGPTRGPWTRRF
jgi:membrane associated rhomboid family serine protease